MVVGNGNGLHIKHSGSTTFQTPHSPKVVLHHILYYPNVPANLLYINHFCYDNCYFLLTISSYIVKDIQTGIGSTK
jgi:hypothetical protein